MQGPFPPFFQLQQSLSSQMPLPKTTSVAAGQTTLGSSPNRPHPSQSHINRSPVLTASRQHVFNLPPFPPSARPRTPPFFPGTSAARQSHSPPPAPSTRHRGDKQGRTQVVTLSLSERENDLPKSESFHVKMRSSEGER
mmetsp:Transcript_32536/g.94072  ORF Transcript_32536/g.94072 Transcript_32536/m.94072 type:complete len:139 (+) Transcript_32536:131-547(+)